MTYGTNIIENAAMIAVVAHNGQTRKNDDTPYVMHPISVAITLSRYGFPDHVVAAALVHDVLEDTDFSEEELRQGIGEEAFAIVKTVTNDPNLPWEEQRAAYVEVLRTASPEAKAVSAADKVANMKNLLAAYAEQGPALWDKFNRGKDKKLWFEELMVSMLKETWSHPLIDEYAALVEQMRALD